MSVLFIDVSCICKGQFFFGENDKIAFSIRKCWQVNFYIIETVNKENYISNILRLF